jgi:hypothetical protein
MYTTCALVRDFGTTLRMELVHLNFRRGFPLDLPLPDEHDREPWQTAEVFRKFQVEIRERGRSDDVGLYRIVREVEGMSSQ